MHFSEQRMIQISSNKWYIETRTGYDGPFDTEDEAKKYLSLLRSCDAARDEFAGLEFSPS